MTTSIVSVDATTSKLQVGGVDSCKFDSTGIFLGAGKRLAQIQTSQTGSVATGTTVIPLDDTIPQNTEGDQYMSLSITPTNVNSLLDIDVTINLSNSVAANIIAALFQDSNVNALKASYTFMSTPTGTVNLTIHYETLAGSLSATTFKVRAGGHTAGTTTFNGVSGARVMGGVMASRITIKEYLP